MSSHLNAWLLAGGVASGAASVAHLLCIPGGAAWYRTMGAGEHMSSAVERGEMRPHLIALAIATVLAGWAVFALSGAGVIGRLPLLRPVLVAVAAIYLLRGLALPAMLRLMPDRTRRFLMVSSLVVLVIGVLHLIGIAEETR